MPNIKEIALKVGLQAFEEHPYDKGHVVSPSGYTWIDDKLIEFAEALVAEIAKGNEPVAWCVGYDDPRMGRIHSNPTMCKPEAEALVKSTTSELIVCSLYALPPTAEQIANETAEAIAEYCRNQDHYCLATEIESGTWKEFKK